MTVRYEVQGSVVTITLDRPEALNAIDPETHDELIKAWIKFRDDATLHVAVLTGAGPKAFCAGVDLKRMGDLYGRTPSERRREVWNREPGVGGITRNLDVGKPVIAAINGHCLGGGLELALACDIRLASPNATFGLPETRWAIIPGQGGTQRLPRTVGTNIALEMILTGDPVSAERAYEVGLVNRIIPLDRLLPEAHLMAAHIASRAPRAIRFAREAVLRGRSLPLEEALRLEQDLADGLRDTPDNQEARKAFAEKREPRWTGH